MHGYPGSAASFPANVGLIDDSDAPNASNFNVAPTNLADRTAWLKAHGIFDSGGTILTGSLVISSGVNVFFNGGSQLIIESGASILLEALLEVASGATLQFDTGSNLAGTVSGGSLTLAGAALHLANLGSIVASHNQAIQGSAAGSIAPTVAGGIASGVASGIQITAGEGLEVINGASIVLDSGAVLSVSSGAAIGIAGTGGIIIANAGSQQVQSGGLIEVQSGGILEVDGGGILEMASGSSLNVSGGATLTIAGQLTSATGATGVVWQGGVGIGAAPNFTQWGQRLVLTYDASGTTAQPTPFSIPCPTDSSVTMRILASTASRTANMNGSLDLLVSGYTETGSVTLTDPSGGGSAPFSNTASIAASLNIATATDAITIQCRPNGSGAGTTRFTVQVDMTFASSTA